MTLGVPEKPELTSEKLLPFEATPVTGSLKITVQRAVPAFVGEGSMRFIEATVGGVWSIVHVYEVGLLVPPPLGAEVTARTRNV